MPHIPRKKNPAADTALPAIPSELIDQIVKGPMSADAVNAASKAFKKALIERCLGAELSHHLGYVPGGEKPEEASNLRNGTSGKTVLTEDGPLRIDIPRDREGSLEPVHHARQARHLGITELALPERKVLRVQPLRSAVGGLGLARFTLSRQVFGPPGSDVFPAPGR